MICFYAGFKVQKILGVQILNPGEERDLQWVKIKAIPAYHPERGHPEGYSIGFLITIEDKKIYYTADTDFLKEMENIKADIMILPVGGTFTMSAREAARTVGFINPQFAIPMHYGKSVGTQDDAELFKELVEDNTKTKVIIMKEGEQIEI